MRPAAELLGPDSATAAVSGSCSDQAGNVRQRVLRAQVRRDGTADDSLPARVADANGWYNHALSVRFTGADATSGIGTCDAPKTYSAPDTASASLGGTCRDLAGNRAPRRRYGVQVRRDSAAGDGGARPGSRTPTAGTARRSRSVSPAATQRRASTRARPRRATRARTATPPRSAGTCRTRPATQALHRFALKYDATAPQATAAPSRAPNANGWFNAPLTVSFAATDATSGLDSCAAAKNYAGPDNATGSVERNLPGQGRQRARTRRFALKYDATAAADGGGSVAPAERSRLVHRAAHGQLRRHGRDLGGRLVRCGEGLLGPGHRLDHGHAAPAATRPATRTRPRFGAQVRRHCSGRDRATPSRQPNAAGWYRAPLTVSFAAHGRDSRARRPARRPRTTPGPTTRRRRSAAPASTMPATRRRHRSSLKYDATAPQASATASAAADCRTAGSTTP